MSLLTVAFAERFWSKVDRRGPEECWPWMAARNPKGYGRVSVARRRTMAHRVALELDGRPLGNGQVARHICDNPPCVNPAHLLAGSHLDNTQDRRERGRPNHRPSVDRCRAGHPYPEYEYRSPAGKRNCRMCHRLRERERKARLRA